MVLEKLTPNSSNVSKIKYNTENQEMAVFFIPKERKNSFKTLEDLQNAQKEILEEDDNSNGKVNVWEVFEEKYKVNFFEELDRLERNSKKIYIFSNVELEVYQEIIDSESVGGTLNKLVTKNKEKYPFKVDIMG